jgi:hypothetical protein
MKFRMEKKGRCESQRWYLSDSKIRIRVKLLGPKTKSCLWCRLGKSPRIKTHSKRSMCCVCKFECMGWNWVDVA